MSQDLMSGSFKDDTAKWNAFDVQYFLWRRPYAHFVLSARCTTAHLPSALAFGSQPSVPPPHPPYSVLHVFTVLHVCFFCITQTRRGSCMLICTDTGRHSNHKIVQIPNSWTCNFIESMDFLNHREGSIVFYKVFLLSPLQCTVTKL